jgi:hypothetical protein
MQAGSRRQAVILRAAQKAEYIWYDGMEGDDSKVSNFYCECSCVCGLEGDQLPLRAENKRNWLEPCDAVVAKLAIR